MHDHTNLSAAREHAAGGSGTLACIARRPGRWRAGRAGARGAWARRQPGAGLQLRGQA